MTIIENKDPDTKPRVCIVRTAQGWYDEARKAQASGDAFAAVMFMENAFNHTENALAAVLQVAQFRDQPPVSGKPRRSLDDMRAELDALHR